MLGKVQARVVRNLEEGFAIEFIHEQIAETLEDNGYRAVKRRRPKSPIFRVLKAVSALPDAAFARLAPAIAVNAGTFAADRLHAAGFRALIDKI